MCVTMQMACRKNIWPLDRSTLFTSVTHFQTADEVEERPQTVNNVLLNAFKFGINEIFM